jgi:hypothetical protein
VVNQALGHTAKRAEAAFATCPIWMKLAFFAIFLVWQKKYAASTTVEAAK